MPRDDDFLEAAEALYALPASGFVAERTARAKRARAEGDRDLAARVAALQKPSAAAALVNRLVHEDGDLMDRVADLGTALRKAQDDGDPARLRELGAQRRRLLQEAADRAADLAGTRPGAAVLEELQQTLQAAVASEDAAAAVATGRLVTALAADGLDPVDLTNAVGGPDRVAPSRPRSAPGRHDEDTATGGPDAAAQRIARREAEDRAEQAERRAAEAERAAADAAAEADAAEARRAEQDRAVADLRERLARLQEELADAEGSLRTATGTASAARGAADDAASGADEARAAAAAREAVPEG